MKQKKGTIGIYSDKGRLFIRLPRSLYGGALVRRALNLSETDDDLIKAETIKQRIENDIKAGVFDPSLEKYLTVKSNQEIFSVGDTWNLPQLFEKYINYKKVTGWSQTTYSNSGLVFLRRFQSLENQNLNQAGLIRDELISNFTLDAAKRSLIQIKACVDWAIKSGYLKENKFSGMAKDIKLNQEEFDINPFTLQERNLIINAFDTNQFARRLKDFSHSQYSSLIKFWFYTGCRTSELLGLKWENIHSTYINFCEARVYSNLGEISKKSLKTQTKRIFPVNDQLKSVIDNLLADKKITDYVFVNHQGEPIHPSALVTCWKKILQGLKISYRRPYQCRHTFITLALNNGMKPHDVARICGTSPQMIYRHYLGIVPESIIVPSI